MQNNFAGKNCSSPFSTAQGPKPTCRTCGNRAWECLYWPERKAVYGQIPHIFRKNHAVGRGGDVGNQSTAVGSLACLADAGPDRLGGSGSVCHGVCRPGGPVGDRSATACASGERRSYGGRLAVFLANFVPVGPQRDRSAKVWPTAPDSLEGHPAAGALPSGCAVATPC